MPQYFGNFMRFGWDPAENGWGDPMNLNLKALDSRINRVTTVEASPPATPSPGQLIIVDQNGASGAFVGQEGKVAYWNVQDSIWEFSSVPVGWIIGDEDATKDYLFTAVDTYVERLYDTSGLAPNNTVKNYFIHGLDQFGRNPNEQLKFAFEDTEVVSKNIFLLENAVYQMTNDGTNDILSIHGDITIQPTGNIWAIVPSGDFNMRVVNSAGASAYAFYDFSQSVTFQVTGTNVDVDTDTPMSFLTLNSNRVFNSILGGETVVAETIQGSASGPNIAQVPWYNLRGLQQVTDYSPVTNNPMTAPGITLTDGIFGVGSPQLFFGSSQLAYIIHQDLVNTAFISGDGTGNSAVMDITHGSPGSILSFTSYNADPGGIPVRIEIQAGDNTNPTRILIKPNNGAGPPAAGVEYKFEDIPQSGDTPAKMLGWNPVTSLVEAFNVPGARWRCYTKLAGGYNCGGYYECCYGVFDKAFGRRCY
jgi:hypothetical protein